MLRSALMLRRAVGRGRFSVTCQAVEIGHQGSVSFKFSQAFHQLIANCKCVRARGRAPARSRNQTSSRRNRGHKMKGRLIVGALAAVPMLATAVAAQAADMGLPVYKAAPTPLQTTNWSGLYFGGHAGAAWGSTNDDFNDSRRLRHFAGIPAFRSTARSPAARSATTGSRDGCCSGSKRMEAGATSPATACATRPHSS